MSLLFLQIWHTALSFTAVKVPAAHSTHPLAATPAQPALHRHAEMFVCFVLVCHEFAGHGVHWLILCSSANVPAGHGEHAVDRPSVAYPGIQTPHPLAAVPENPTWHKHAEMVVCCVLVCHEFSGHCVHWLILCLSAKVPAGHGEQAVNTPGP